MGSFEGGGAKFWPSARGDSTPEDTMTPSHSLTHTHTHPLTHTHTNPHTQPNTKRQTVMIILTSYNNNSQKTFIIIIVCKNRADSNSNRSQNFLVFCCVSSLMYEINACNFFAKKKLFFRCLGGYL